MTFNQWAAGLGLDRALRISLKAVWDRLIAAGVSEPETTHLIDDLLDGIREQYE